ncbi:GBF-interacting protein 1-like [Durio zibethinus]|uniref:GBF-interacting protein 1-like n=1 Tax=Durio zibethinus TaxID=66656 RepID=A0A6P6BBY6_DURZI|nr:GBF-interacting protein 1-like [Durio zibethinus]
MDPNDAVQRLLSQDTFHGVKSKREKRKEMKKPQELKARASNGASNPIVRGGSEHSFGRSRSIGIRSNGIAFGACMHWWQ